MTTSLREEYEKSPHSIGLYKLLVEGIQDYAIYLLDASGYVETWNTGAQNITGYSASEVIDKHLSMFYTPSDIANNKPDKGLLHAAQYGRIEEESWRVRKDGTRFWANTVTTALYQHNSLIGFAKVTRDLTARKKRKDALIIANQLLKRQRVELEVLNNVKDEFISLASHQLRTPATGIKQYLGMLLEGYAGELSPQQQQFLQRAYDSNERQIRLVNSLLRTAQLDAGKVSLSKTTVNIRKIIDEVVDSLNDLFAERKQTVSVDEKASISPIQADESKIRMVIENLIDNASKYTDTGGTITVHLSETKKHICLTIEDTGVGIAQEDIGRVFDKFNRIPNRLSAMVEGNGLGLYWVKKIINLHKGKITVSSQLDAGTEFKVLLPKEGTL